MFASPLNTDLNRSCSFPLPVLSSELNSETAFWFDRSFVAFRSVSARSIRFNAPMNWGNPAFCGLSERSSG